MRSGDWLGLLHLLEKEDEEVWAGIKDSVLSQGVECLLDLKAALRDLEDLPIPLSAQMQIRKKHLLELVERIESEEAISELKDLISKKEGDILRGLYLLDKVFFPECVLPWEKVLEKINTKAIEVWVHLKEEMTVREKASCFNDFMYRQWEWQLYHLGKETLLSNRASKMEEFYKQMPDCPLFIEDVSFFESFFLHSFLEQGTVNKHGIYMFYLFLASRTHVPAYGMSLLWTDIVAFMPDVQGSREDVLFYMEVKEGSMIDRSEYDRFFSDPSIQVSSLNNTFRLYLLAVISCAYPCKYMPEKVKKIGENLTVEDKSQN